MPRGEMKISTVTIEWTLDLRQKSSSLTFSPEFRFGSGEWSLGYCYAHVLGRFHKYHILSLKRKSGECRHPINVLVQLESGITGRIVTPLSQHTRFTVEFIGDSPAQHIWMKPEYQILEVDPGFGRSNAILKLLVTLKANGDIPLAGTSFSSLESDHYANPEAISTANSSVQTALDSSSISSLETLSKDLAKLLDPDFDSDVEFQCVGHSTGAHRKLLEVRSPVLASMLASDMVEGRTGIVTIPDMEPDVFQHFLKYIYSGRLPTLSFEVALNLYEAGRCPQSG